MESGNIVEYIDRQKIVCAVVMEVKNQRLRLLSENNREVKLSVNRLSHRARTGLDMSLNRDKLAETLKTIAQRRRTLAEAVEIGELWDVLNSEQEWIDLETMTEFCFPDDPTPDHEAAVVRAFFKDRLYFKFNHDRFFPYSEAQVEQMRAHGEEIARRNRIIEMGSHWIRRITEDANSPFDGATADEQQEFINILRSYYLFEKESPHSSIAKEMISRAGIDGGENLFHLFVKLNVWGQDENIDLYRYEVPTDFSEKLMAHTRQLLSSPPADSGNGIRRDLTGLRTMTIDGQATLDFDDALSFEEKDGHYLLGVHIADVGEFVERDSPLDREALLRGSSIYMPDQKIPMLPPSLAEGRCSLKAGEIRPAISTMIRLSPIGDILGYEIFPSLIRVTDQLTYYDVNMMAEENREIILLHRIAREFRQKRLSDGAVQISLPEVNIWLDEEGEVVVSKTNRESPGRLLVSEIMIMANWLMATFLSEQGLPAIYRSQPDPKERLYKSDEGSLFQNWMQRRLLSRFMLSTEAERHSGLGLGAYVTATSPIRKYFDLVTQRQIRSVFGLETVYTADEIRQMIQLLEQPMSCVSRLQYRRKRYWLLKYLETKTGQKEQAIVLNRRRNSYQALITEYMTECSLPLSSGIRLKPEDMIQVTIQHVNARKDIFSVFIG
ncbi:RNB domain-containing ribonuclease [Desulfonema ishimotonii]|uniref:RNB domain-containing ribonuclease n=1 Tax=Desulfonema ishimotonii TaxID=45657 RepID=A0A401FX90_9BACT|nr:ribonuclease catalytic domain-containing protein [Desulfonema ishimotonii]GBC61580.1 RNB domain-containing ribonuclease [Desulfonema ishimotonii]